MNRRLFATALLALLVTGLVAGCSGGGSRRPPRELRDAADSLSSWRWRADSVDAALGSMELFKGQVPVGGGTASWAAWFDSGEVRVIHEEMNLGQLGSRSNRYYFEKGAVRFTLETGMVPTDSTQVLHRLDRAMLFDDFGTLRAGSKRLDSLGVAVAGYEASATAGHAQQLRVAAQSARAGTTGPPPPPEGGVPARH